MADRENVIKALEYCGSGHREFSGCNGCPYKDEFHRSVEECLWCRINDALALLKEQEAVEPIPYHRSDGTIFKYECRKCGTKIFKMDLFCRHCGKAVKWNDT